MAWTDTINMEDLPEDYQLVANIVGLEKTIQLAYELKKVSFYLRDPDRLFFPAKKRYVLERWQQSGPDDQFRPKLVALETGLSERAIYDIINETRGPKEKQVSLFEKED